jgi:Tfp pilus assembly protein PilV
MKSKWNTNINIKRPAKFIGRLAAAGQGFTLVEVLIAIFLLMIALFAIISTTDLLIKENAFDKMSTTATTLAKDKMEFFKNQSYVSYAGLIAGTDTDYATIDSTIQTTQTGAFYTRTWTITNDSPAAAMKTINVTVSWSLMGTNKTVSLSYIVSA